MCRGSALLVSKKDGQITERLGTILRELRGEKGLTREELAERSETGLRYVAAILKCLFL
jgi:ribosome-binding protein aMBF1 (putative translation factor)